MRKIGVRYRKLLAASGISNIADGVGVVAYPWLASAVTRNPVLISMIVVVQRLPWLLFSLPIGVLTDRKDRRVLMIIANVIRAAITLAVAIAVLGLGGDLPGPDEVRAVVGTDHVLYATLLVATLVLGFCEVLYDNSAQTFVPSVVGGEHLERANGRLYSVELAANQYAGPPLGSALLAIGFAVPFFINVGTFALAAVLLVWIGPVARRLAADATPTAQRPDPAVVRPSWRAELHEGIAWLWRHRFLRDLAIALGVANGLGMMTVSAWVLFAQEVLGTGTRDFALIAVISATGGLLAGWWSGAIISRLATATVLRVAMVTFTLVSLGVGSVSWWPVAAVILGIEYFVMMLWNVVTVTLRQTLIPDHLLGRVNSVYRFLAWGMMPIGAVLGGLVIAISERFASREVALRMPWWVAAAIYVVFGLLFAWPRLSPAAVAAAKEESRGAGPGASGIRVDAAPRR